MWSGASVIPNESTDRIWLRLSGTEPGTCRFAAAPNALKSGLCSPAFAYRNPGVVDLTSQPYLPPDRATAEGRAALPGISLALNDYGPDEVPDVRPRPLEELVAWANTADEHRDQGRFFLAGRDLGTLLTELQAHALRAGPAERTRAFTALVQACVVAGDVATRLAGKGDLAISATRRGYDMATRHGDPALIGFAS